MAGDLLGEFELLMGCAKYCQDIPRPLRPRQSQIDENKDPCSEMAACCALPPLIGCGDCRPHSDLRSGHCYKFEHVHIAHAGDR